MLPDSRVRQRDFLLEISRALTQELDLDRVLGRILDITLDMLGGQAGLIALRTGINGWHVRVSRGLPSPYLDLINPFLAKVPLENDPEQAELPEINRWLNNLVATASMGLFTGVGIPLVTRQHVVGVIFIFRGYQGLFSANDRSLLSSFADQAAIAVQNALLYTQVTQETQRLTGLLDTAADGILILNPDLRIERVNPAFLKIICRKKEEVLNHFHEEIIRWVNPPEQPTLEKSVLGGWPLAPHSNLYVEGDLLRDHRHSSIPVSITYAPLISSESHLLNIIVDVRDITRFRQADELKSTFISIISHELKTPVALIKGYVSTLRREDARWDKHVVRESLKVIEEEADRLTGLIENLLDASRLQAGGLAIKKSDCNLPEMVRRVAEKFRVQDPEHPIIVDFPRDFPVILADENRMEQVVANLFSNSIKYAPKGDIHISGQVQPDNIIICVKDEGPGINPEDVPYVFDRFFRADAAAKNTKGAGLGLYLAKSIVESHSGRIWVDADSTKGKGTRICFSLPIQPLENPSQSE
jgi:signal transduction histidine kinase